MDNITELATKVIAQYKLHISNELFTVAISGIDASGKGYITKLLRDTLDEKGYRVANINIDPWQNPISIRLRKENAVYNVYENIFRWKDFFEQLILPLKKKKSLYLETQVIRSDADVYYTLVYEYKHIDILLIEGILLFKRNTWLIITIKSGLIALLRRG
jgi:uridine kinase